MEKWRKKNRDKIRVYFRKYYKVNKYIVPSLKKRYKGDENNTSSLGRKYELLALSLLKNSTDMNSECFIGGYDIEWKGKKIEVKMRNRGKFGWTFTFKKGCTATHTLMFCVDDGIQRILLMPYKKQKGIYVSTENLKQFEIVFSNEKLLK